MSIISDSMLRNNDNDRASAQYASSQPYSQTYSDKGSSNDNQQGLLERIFNGLGAASDWINNNVDYVENSPVRQWIGNKVEYVENSPVGQAVSQTLGQALAPANSIFQNWPALLGIAANAAVTPKDNDTFSGSLYDAGVNGVANTVGNIADLMHKDDLAAAMYTLANKTQDNAPVQADWDWDYITSPHGLTRSFGNVIGSMAPLLPAMALVPESLVAAAGRLSPWLANGVRYGFTAIPEAMAEGGQTRREAIEDGLNHPDLRAFGTLAKNLPLLAVSNTLEGAILGGGLGKVLAGKAGESVLGRMAKAPFRATPSALAEGLQNGFEEGLQQGIQNASVDKEHGYLPWNWTNDQWDAAREGFFGTLPLGGIGGARKAVFPGVGDVVGAPDNGPDNTDPVVVAQLTGKNDDVPTADGVDVTNLDPQQYTQWYGEKLKSQGIDVPDATITVQTPKATGATGGAKAGAGANVMDAAQDFMGQHMENGANGCVEAVTKIGARYNPFLADELSKGVVNVDTLVADAGDKVIPFDPNNLEAGDVIVYDNNDHVVLYDGNGGYVGNSSSQQKVVQGGDYNNMGGLKPTKIIKTGNGVTAQNTQETTNNGGAPAADLSSLPVGDIATAIAQNTGLPANFIWAQLSHESDGGNSKLAREDHNYGGVKGNDGEYLHFDNDQQFIDYMSDYYPKYREDGIYDAQTADQFAEALQHGGYFTADLGEYEGGMHRYLEQAGLSDSGTAGAPAEKQSTVNTMTQQQFGDMLNEKMIDFAGTNDDTVKTVFNDMSTSKDKALVSLFSPYMQDGVFANTAANRTALVNNDGFKKAMAMFLSKHLSDYAPAFENGRISFQQAEEALRPRHQVQAAQTAQAPNIQTAASPKMEAAAIQNVLSSFAQDKKNVARTEQEANLFDDMLDADDHFIDTPKNRQILLKNYGAQLQNYVDDVMTPSLDDRVNQAIEQAVQNKDLNRMNILTQAKQANDTATLEKLVGPQTKQHVDIAAMLTPANTDVKNHVSSMMQGNALVHQTATMEHQAPQNEVASTVQGNTPVQQAPATENEMPQGKVAPTIQANMPVNQTPTRMDNQQAAQQDAPKGQVSVTPLPTQKGQQSEGVRIAQPQQTIDEQNAQTDARIAEIKKTPLAQRKALGQQYLDTLRQNNVPFSEKKLAKSLMNGDPEAIEHVQRTYGDLLNTITPEEAAAASQHAPRTIQVATTARLGNMVSEITSGNTYKNASPVGKLAYLSAAGAHAKTVGADKSARAIDSIIADVRKKAGFSGKGTTEGMTPEQKDEFYNAFYKQSLDDATAIRKEAADEKPANLKSLDNTIEMFKQELAKSKPTKEERKKVTHESTQSKSQNEPDKGAKNQDQHTKPEPRKTADTQREAEEGEVSATKKAADKGGRDEQTLSEKEVVLKHISTLFGKPITNKETGIVATFGTKGANKMVSNKAVDKTVKNGYSQHEHLEAVKDIKRLYEDAGLSVQHEDRDKSPNILSIKRFRTNMTTVDGNPATAKITVKETKQNGHKIYSIELEALEKPSELNHARADSSEGQTVRPTKGKQPSSAYADESSSSTHIIPHEQKEGTKNLDTGKVPAMGEPIHGIKGTETTVVTDSGKEIRTQEESDATSDIQNANAASTEDRSVETNPHVLSYKRKAQEIVSSFEKRKVNLTDARQEIKDLMAKANEERWGQKMSNDECMAAQGFLSDALSKLNAKQAKKRKARKSIAKAKAEEKSNESIFGSVEDADKEMLDALGLSEDDLTDDVLTAPDGIKNTAEERERLEKELSAELNKMSAMPMFNPKIYTLGLKLAMTYVKDGINTVKKLVAKLNATFGDKIGPWAPALAETVRTWPKGVPFDEKKFMAISKAVGARYENGITSLDGMQADMKKLMKGQHDSFAPMIEASYNGIRKFFEAQKGENNHANDSTSGLAERVGRGSDSDRVGPDDAGGESGRRSGRGVQETERAVQPEGGARVRDRSAAAGGETGNSRVQVEESGDRAGSAGSAHVSRSVRDSYEGSVGHDADRNAADIKPAQNRRDNASPAGARARAVKPNKSHKQGDLGSIKNDLPMLKPEQQEDVEFIETRVNVNNKPGVMLTNGTGTGKTYSGLGFVKRMYDAGKKNILIVSPSESINDQWIEAASKHFDLSIEKLDSTKDSGKDGGICITTYANLQANKELVNRNWDAVVSDESHTLMQNEKGEETGYLSMLRALTLNPRGAYKRWKLQHRTKEIRSLENQIEEREKKAKAILRPYKDKKKVSSADKAKVDALQKEIEDLNKEMEGIFWKMSPGTDKLMQDLKAAYPEEKRPKVLFLSATPFAHDKDVDYAEGYLFNYDDQPNTGAYNQGTPFDRFMIKHFGYRMRTNKLTRPDAEVDSRAMEVQFHDDLVNSGAMHGRQIDVDKDYDRGFILVDGGIGHKIDEGFKFLSDNHAAYGELHQALLKQFNKSQQKYLIESIKAREVIPLIQEYVKKGKKVVLFHQSMVEHKNIHPFQLKPSDGLAENAAVWAQWKAFKSARPDLVNLSLGNIPAPMETLRKELGGHAVFINGSVLKKDRAKNIEQFNDDNSGVNIIVCQQDAANAGISLHDTTGKHPRVLINIAMPERPSYAMQIEGRIYRVGNASNAVFRYLSTGTDIEKNMFASTIGGRAASVENLAVGNAARGLRESFRDLYQETMDGSWRRRLPGAKGEGTGGKEMDYAVTADLSDYDRAKSFYFAHQKRTSRTKAQEGNDYFATPEPIGYKMVEWLGLKSGEKALEPSAGHGAISRWFPETTERTIVEPSGKLMPLAQMNTPGAKTVHGSFEDFNIVNKFDGIAMNPPYGTGGKTAIEHLQKAFKQLHDGGRVVAIIPEGPAADKRYSKMMEEISSEVVPIADIHLPAVAFSRAGTKVGTHIVVLDRYTGKAAHQAALDHFGGADDIDLRGIDSINDLFDRMENMAMPERYDASNVRKAEPAPTPAVQLDEARVEGVPDETPNFTADEYEHTKTHEVKFRARPKSFLGENYRPIQKLAKAHGGYYSKFAKNSFLFEDEDERNAFLQEAEALLSDGKASAKGSVAEMVKHIDFPEPSSLTTREKAMQEFGQQMGVKVVFFDGPANLRGFYNKGITFINRSASKSPSWVFWHENLHWLRSNNPELYRQMVDYISGRQEFAPEQLQAYRDAIGRPELTDADTIEEMLADAMPDVHKRVDLFRKMGRENKSLIQRFFGWLRDTMAAFHNVFSQPSYGLSKTQAKAMRDALANIAEDLRDGEGRRIFRTRGADREILTAQGEELSYPTPDDDTRYSADGRDDKPAGSPGMIRRGADNARDVFRKVGSGEVWERQLNSKDSGNRYLVTNDQIRPDTEVPIIDVTDEPKVNVNNHHAAADIARSMIGKTFRIIGSDGYGKIASVSDGMHFVHSSNNPVRFDKTRRKALSVAEKILGNCVYIEKHGDLKHGTKKSYIEMFSVVKDGSRLVRFRIVAKEGDKDSHAFRIGEAKFYDIIKDGALQESGVLRHYKHEGAPSTLTIAELLKGVKDREGHLYVNKDGSLNYDTRIFHNGEEQGGSPSDVRNSADLFAIRPGEPIRYSLDANDNSKPSLFTRAYNHLTGRKNAASHDKNVKAMLENITKMRIRFGKLDPKTETVFKKFEGVIRARNANEWEKVLPEAGRAIADRLNLKPSEDMNNYIAKWLLDEATNDTSQEASDFAAALKNDPVLSDQLVDLKTLFNERNNREADEVVRDAIQYEKPKERTTLTKAWETFYDEMIEELGPVKRMVKRVQEKSGQELAASVNPYIALRLFRGNAGRAMTMIEGQSEAAVKALQTNYPGVNFNGFKTLHMILDECGALHNEKRMKDFLAFALACHVKDIHTLNNRIRKSQQRLRDKIADLNDKINNLPEYQQLIESDKKVDDKYQEQREAYQKEIEGYQAKIDKAEKTIMEVPRTEDGLSLTEDRCNKVMMKYMKEYGEAQQDLVHFSKVTTSILYDAGVISKKRYKELQERWPNYIPMFRVFEDNEEVDFGDSLKHMHGSTRRIINPLDSIIRNTYDFVKKAERNKARQLLANLTRISDVGEYIEEVNNSKPNDKTTITFYENGERKYLQTDPDIVKAVNNMGREESNWVLRLLHGPAKIARACFTTINPSFALRNLIRDSTDATIYSKYGFKPWDFVRGFLHAVHRDELFYEWLSSGAAQASAISLDRDYTQATLNQMSKTWKERLLSKEFLPAILEGMQMVGEYSEYGTRIAAYERVKKKLAGENGPHPAAYDLVSAAFESRDLMDFARGGRGSRHLNNVVVFANASIQGFDKFFRTFDFRKPYRKESMKALARLFLCGMLPALLLAGIHSGDDWWEELPDWQKETNWILGKVGNTIIRIPKGQDIGLRFFSNLIEKAMDRSKHKAGDYFKPVWDSLPDMIPTALLPIIEATANHSYFTGAPVVPKYQEKLPAYLQFGNETSSFAKFVGKVIGVSPRKVEHVLFGYTGNMGKGLLGVYDTIVGNQSLNTNLNEAPVISGFTAIPYKQSKTVNDFYDKFDEQQRLNEEFKLTKKKPDGYDPSLYKRMTKAQQELSKINKQERAAIDDPKMDSGVREQKQLGYQQQRLSVVRRVMGQ